MGFYGDAYRDLYEGFAGYLAGYRAATTTGRVVYEAYTDEFVRARHRYPLGVLSWDQLHASERDPWNRIAENINAKRF